MSSQPVRQSEAGYALLFICMMAACVAIMLYMELPRVAFEAQRQKEQLLIDRGEQYERGIQLYFRKFQQYPASLDALDNTQNIRFLRHRYKDPMTGSDEWRLIHVGPGGAFIDSILNKGKTVAPAAPDKSALVAENPLVASGSTDANTPVNLATRRRPSDAPGGAAAAPLDPNAPPPNPSAGLNNPAAIAAGMAGQIPGQMPGSVPQAVPQSGIPAQQNPYAQTAMPGQPGAPPAAAANLINQLLTSPRPGGLNGNMGTPATPGMDPNAATAVSGAVAPGAAVGSAPGVPNTGTPIAGAVGTTISGGIAGVASKAEGEGIKRYNDRSKYSEWEFIYDLSKDLSRAGGGQTLPQPGQMPQNGINPQGSFNSSPQSSGFGSQPQSTPFGGQSQQPVPPPPAPPAQQ